MCFPAFENKMTTDYQNMSYFEAAAVFMIVVGVALIGFQFFIAMPDDGKKSVISAIEIFDLNEALQTERQVSSFVFNGITDFYDEFYVASEEIMQPVAIQFSNDFNNTVASLSNTYQVMASMSDDFATNYNYRYEKNAYTMPGVEAGSGGKVMGAYIEKLND